MFKGMPRLRRFGSRGLAELGVVAVVASLVVGVLVGNGVARTVVDVADGVTWLDDEPRGELVQINPATGQPEVRLDVGSPGDGLDVVQQDGRLVVVNQKTGAVTAFDLATLLASGQRIERGRGSTEVLLSHGDVFLADKARGTLANVDPITLDSVGALWSGPAALTDAAIDAAGTIWALTTGGALYGLSWSPGSQAFSAAAPRRIDGSGPRSVLVPHDKGVTVFGPDNGVVVQVGTGHDVVGGAPHLQGDVQVATQSPRDFVPASSAETSTVVIVGGGKVREVNVSSVGCARPGAPQVFRGVVYVPCEGARKVIRLDRDGRRIGDDIVTPDGGDPEIVIDDGRVLINVPGAETGVEVREDGTSRTFRRHDPRLPKRPVVIADHADDRTEIERQRDADRQADQDRQGDRRRRHDRPEQRWTPPVEDRSHDEPSRPKNTPPELINWPGSTRHTPTSRPTSDDEPSTPSTPRESTPTFSGSPIETPVVTPTLPPTAPDQEPTGVAAAARPDGRIDVNWRHAGPAADKFTVVDEASGRTLATVTGGRSATVSGVSAGTSARFYVVAFFGSKQLKSDASTAVTAYGRPGQVSGISGREVSRSGNQVTVRIDWNAAPANGSAVTEYRVTTEGGFAGGSLSSTRPGSSGSITLTLDCAGSFCDRGGVRTTVVAVNAAGTGPAVSSDWTVGAQPPPPLPAAGAAIFTGTTRTPPDEMGQDITLKLSPPADWAGFGGTCTILVGGSELAQIGCNATTFSQYFEAGSYTVKVRATNAGGSVESAAYTFMARRMIDRCGTRAPAVAMPDGSLLFPEQLPAACPIR